MKNFARKWTAARPSLASAAAGSIFLTLEEFRKRLGQTMHRCARPALRADDCG